MPRLVALPLVAGILLAPLSACGQESGRTVSPVTAGQRIGMHSHRLGERVELDVFVPPRWTVPGQAGRFITVYVLDGDASYLHAVSAVQSLVWEEDMPPAIVVGVRNRNLDRDFTPGVADAALVPRSFRSSGGADAFLDFLEQEAIPLIDSAYPTLPYRVILGHSLGGLLVMHALTVRPSLFSAHIALDPSSWWEGGAAVRRLVAALKRPGIPTPRFVAIETSGTLLRASWPEIREAIGNRGIAHFFEMRDESHTGMLFPGRHRALRALFTEYVPRSRADTAQRSLAALEAQYAELSRRWGFPVAIPGFALASAVRQDSLRGRRR